jgi:positive regulator of sigma E activity
MREKAKVTSVSGPRVRVSVVGSCDGTCAHCGRTDNARTFEALNESGIGLAPGDEVEVFVAAHRAIAEGILLFILPLALFAGGYGVARALSGSDPAGFLWGCCGVGLGFLVNFVRAFFFKEKALPKITRKIEA